MGREGLSAAAAGDDLGLFDVEVGDADQLNLRQPGQDASMLLAEMPDPDDGQPQTCHGSSSRSPVARG